MSAIALPMASLDIDYPSQDQTINSSTYTIRVGAPENLVSMEISIDRGPWKPARRACGYWWFDWAHYPGGEHVIVARGQTRDGSPVGSTPRRCVVSKR